MEKQGFGLTLPPREGLHIEPTNAESNPRRQKDQLEPAVLRSSQLPKKDKNSKLLLIIPILLRYVGVQMLTTAQGELKASLWAVLEDAEARELGGAEESRVSGERSRQWVLLDRSFSR